METIEGNKLIAEFMKPQHYDKRRKDFPFPFPVIEIVPAEHLMGYGHVPEGEIKHFHGGPDMMKYHSSWDWLMPVVEKISKDYSWYCSNESGKWQIIIDIASINIVAEDLFEVTYKVCIDFIEWYNKQK